MKKILIEGNHLLSGTIKIGGAKNSAVALLPAAIMAKGVAMRIKPNNIWLVKLKTTTNFCPIKLPKIGIKK